MNILLREAQPSDMPFLREMLYEAVFWRDRVDKPGFEEGLAFPEVRNALADWGIRDGDTAVIATINSVAVSAAWYRLWTDDDFTRGYVDEDTPVVAIGVHRDFRHRGIGKKMMRWLIDCASKQAIQQISLCVSKDNYAINLYRQQGFVEYVDIGDSFIMVRKIIT
jgi:ribosomal protein S18 acetylase RimI-like enzyme